MASVFFFSADDGIGARLGGFIPEGQARDCCAIAVEIPLHPGSNGRPSPEAKKHWQPASQFLSKGLKKGRWTGATRRARRCSRKKNCRSRARKIGSTARTAPLWITTLNNCVCRGIQCSAISKCPVDETGRNSVIPSIIPNKTTEIQTGIRRLDFKTFGKTRRN